MGAALADLRTRLRLRHRRHSKIPASTAAAPVCEDLAKQFPQQALRALRVRRPAAVAAHMRRMLRPSRFSLEPAC